GINNGRTNPVKTSRNLVAATAKFTTSMKDRENRFNSRSTGFLLNIYWNTPTIINNSNGIIRFNKDLNMTSKTS
ncbi:hypothetical protein D823_07238, partial [Streptococcus sobrinus DSM 20742 = ATCC 33478]